MLSLDIFGPGVTDASADRARRAIDQLLAERGIRMWHAASAAHHLERWTALWFGHPDVPQIPDAMFEARRVWWLVEDALEELCGRQARAVVVGEPEAADEQMPWPPLTYPEEEEVSDEQNARELQALIDKGWVRPT